MLSNRPYLLRAFHEWIVDSACTPILVLDANNPSCKIPQDYAEGGEIVFNISSIAVRDLKMTNEMIEFKASFTGVIHVVSAPISAILAVYAEENGEGLFFDAEEESGGTGTNAVKLKSIDGSVGDALAQEITSGEAVVTRSKPVLTLVE